MSGYIVSPQADEDIFEVWRYVFENSVPLERLRRTPLLYDLFVHSIWRKIDFSWPGHGAMVDEHTFKKYRFPQRRKHAGKLRRCQAHPPAGPVRKTNIETVVGFRFHFHHIPIHTELLLNTHSYTSGSIFAGDRLSRHRCQFSSNSI